VFSQVYLTTVDKKQYWHASCFTPSVSRNLESAEKMTYDRKDVVGNVPGVPRYHGVVVIVVVS